MKEQKTEIKKIVLAIEGKEIVLSVEGAKKLKELLSELFGREVVKETHHHSYSSYIPTWPRPYYYGLSSNGTAVLSDTSSIAKTYGAELTEIKDIQKVANQLSWAGAK